MFDVHFVSIHLHQKLFKLLEWNGEEQTNFVILLCPSAKCRTLLQIIPQYYIGRNK